MHNFTKLTAAAFAALAVNVSAETMHWVVKPVPALRTSRSAPQVQLASGTLPRFALAENYMFDFKTLTSVVRGPGVGDVQYALKSGTLPSGLSISSDGLLSGRPNRGYLNEYAITIQASYQGVGTEHTYSLKHVSAR
ncbi:putative Ig domain-containing protein [Acidovorax sp.]|uniref:putative Ig domain-containing protein n=1 Tax=Acidovorax sp. TaxID=1872122 RepID=UPI00391FC3E0